MHPSRHLPSRPLPAVAIASLLGAALMLAPEHAHGRPAASAADGPADLQYVSQVGGSLIDIAVTDSVDDKRLFVAMGARIEVYDVRDAGAPRRLGESAPLPSNATHLDVDGGQLYATLLGGPLLVFNLAGLPEVVGTLPGAGDLATDLRVEGGIAYVLAQSFGLRILDVRDPASPRLLAKWPNPEEGLQLWSVYGAGERLYVSAMMGRTDG